MKNKKLITLLLVVVLILAMSTGLFSACSFYKYDIKDFANQLFASAFSNDAMSANFFLENPEAAIGATPKVSLSSPLSKDDYYSAYTSYRTQAALMSVQFKYNKMSGEDKELFAFLQDFFVTQSKFADYYYFQDDFIGGYSGAQANIPLYLIEYKFRDEQDIKDYIELCQLTATTFPTWISYEQARLDNGYGRMKYILYYAVEQADSFTGAPIINDAAGEGATIEELLNCDSPSPYDEAYVQTDSFVLTNAIAKLNACDYLTTAQKTTYEASIRTAVNNYLIPAYIKLGVDIKDMILNSSNSGKFGTGGLAGYENGQGYYQTLLNYSTGSNDSVNDIYNSCMTAYEKTVSSLTNLRTALNTLGVSDPDHTVVDMFNADEWTETALYNTISTLKSSLSANFPAMAENSGAVRLKVIDESLADYFAPAAYYVSALDNRNSDEVIVINNWNSTGYLSYDLLSHEGIPGHLYQYNYLKNSSQNNAVKLLCSTAYKEGWATYAENYMAKSYGAAGSRDNLLMQYQVTKTLAKGYIRVMADIAVNYSGYGSNIVDGAANNQYTVEYWLKNTLNLTDSSYLMSGYTTDEDELVYSTSTVADFANNLSANSVMFPCNAATYYYSYLQLSDIISALKSKGYSDYDAHKAILDSPYSFALIKEKYNI